MPNILNSGKLRQTGLIKVRSVCKRHHQNSHKDKEVNGGKFYQIFLLVELREKSDLVSERKRMKKSSENDQLTGRFQSFFF